MGLEEALELGLGHDGSLESGKGGSTGKETRGSRGLAKCCEAGKPQTPEWLSGLLWRIRKLKYISKMTRARPQMSVAMDRTEPVSSCRESTRARECRVRG